MLDTIRANHAVFQKHREYQKQINAILGKISTPADRIEALTILLGANLNELSALLDRLAQLQQRRTTIEETAEG